MCEKASPSDPKFSLFSDHLNPEIFEEILKHKDLPNQSPFSNQRPRVRKAPKENSEPTEVLEPAEAPEPVVFVEKSPNKPSLSDIQTGGPMLSTPAAEKPYQFEENGLMDAENKENVNPCIQLPPVETLMSDAAQVFVS